MIRTFVALNIPESVRDKIISIRNSVINAGNLRWEPKEKLHLTLKFIGDIEESKIDPVISLLDFLETYPSLKCIFNKFGFFYRNARPAILWAGLDTDEIIHKMVKELDNKLLRISIPTERKEFKSHLTLMRIKSDPGNHFVNSFKNFTFEPIVFTADSISFFKSELHPAGSKYFEIKNYKLK